MTGIDDSTARDLAVDPSRSVLLQAPAGSGKTTVLIQRYLRLLAEVDAPEQVIAITFTRKAAGEMRTRIAAALRAALEPARAGSSDAELRTRQFAQAALQRSRALDWQLESNPGRLRIQTIDALNQRLAGSLPIAARLGGELETATDAAPLYERAARQALRNAETDSRLAVHSDLWLTRLGNDWTRLEALLAELLARRNHWLRHVSTEAASWLRTRVERSLATLVADEIAGFEASADREWTQTGLALVAEAGAALDGDGRELPAAWQRLRVADADERLDVDAARWQALAHLGLTQKGEVRSRLDRKLGFLPRSDAKQRAEAWLETLGATPPLQRSLQRAAALPEPRLAAEDGQALESLIELLQHAAAELLLVFAERGQMDHAAVSAAARQALAGSDESAPAALQELELLRHVLVDEFQDTSIEQFELIERLISPWQPGEPRSLFLVGDPMQSIYQFREAEVALFMRARDQGIGGWSLEALALTRNFRSAPALVQFVNSTFEKIFPDQENERAGAVRFLPSAAGRSATALPARIELHRLGPSDGAAEADRAVQLVRRVRENAPQASIAVLVAARAHAAPISARLRLHGIPVRGVDLVPLADVPVVQDLIALSRAFLSPLDRIAWLALLRAPWCGLTLPELTRWLDAEPGSSIAGRLGRGVAPGDPAGLQRLARVVAGLRAGLDRSSLARCVEAAWLQLGGPACYESATASADAATFFVALHAAGDRGALQDAADLERLVDGLYAASEAGTGAVEIMTIHRSKGLEFDCVLLPGLGRGASADRDPLLEWFEWSPRDGVPQLVLAPIRPAGEDLNGLGRWLRDLRRARREHERARVLYVAATRARSELHLLAEIPAEEAEGSVAAWTPRSGTALATLWPAIGERLLALPPPAAGSTAGDASPRALRRLSDGWRHPGRAPAVAILGVETAAELPAEAVEFRWVGETARRIGVVVHRELQRCTEGRGDSGAQRAARVAAWLQAEGIASAEIAAASTAVLAAVDRTLADATGRWLLDGSHQDSACELALSGLIDGRVQNVVIDRCFVDANGLRWVVDYKTSQHEGGDLDGFLANELRRYRAQLERYRTLARGLGPQPVQAALYFPLLARLVRLEA